MARFLCLSDKIDERVFLQTSFRHGAAGCCRFRSVRREVFTKHTYNNMSNCFLLIITRTTTASKVITSNTTSYYFFISITISISITTPF